MGFAESVRGVAAKQQLQVNKKVLDIAKELFTAAVDFSPKQPAAKYSKGEFINNWMPAINRTDASTTRVYGDDGGASSRNRIEMTLRGRPFLVKDGYVTLSNSVHYAELVEYHGWRTEDNPRWKNSPPYAPVESAFIKVMPKIKGGLKW